MSAAKHGNAVEHIGAQYTHTHTHTTLSRYNFNYNYAVIKIYFNIIPNSLAYSTKIFEFCYTTATEVTVTNGI